jgi:hypothetical protein
MSRCVDCQIGLDRERDSGIAGCTRSAKHHAERCRRIRIARIIEVELTDVDPRRRDNTCHRAFGAEKIDARGGFGGKRST